MNNKECGERDNLRDKMDRVEDNVIEILNVLKGDDFGQSKGLVEEVKNIKSRVRSLEEIKNKVIYLASGAGVGAGFAIDKIVSFFKSIVAITILSILVSSCASTARKKSNAHLYFSKNKKELYDLCEVSFPTPVTPVFTLKKGDINVKVDSIYVPKSIQINRVDCPDGSSVTCPECVPDTLKLFTTEYSVDTLEITSFKYKSLYDDISKELGFEKRIKYYLYAAILILLVTVAIIVINKRKS